MLNPDNPLELYSAVIAEIREYMLFCAPCEGCGIISNGKFVPMPNVAPNKVDHFEISPSVWVDYKVDGVVHSHCAPCHPEPTSTDMICQIKCGVPWGIVHVVNGHASKPLWWGDFRLSVPLVGRKFIWCAQDCYTLVRSEEFQRTGIIVPDEARDPWWKSDVIGTADTSKMYLQMPSSTRREVGDVICMKIQHKFIDHFGIQVADGQMLHHMVDMMSARTPITRYEPFIQQIWRLRPEVRAQLAEQQKVLNAA